MTAFNKFSASVFLAVVYSSSALAAPSVHNDFHLVNSRVRDFVEDLNLTSYHPATTFETFDEPLDHALSSRQDFDLQKSTTNFLASHFSVGSDKIAYISGYEGETAYHAYVQQTYDGIPLANAVANVAYDRNYKVTSVGSSFVEIDNPPSSIPSISIEEAIAKAEGLLGASRNDIPPTLEYVARDGGKVVLAHAFQLRDDAPTKWYEVFMDAHSNELVSMINYAADARYRAVPIQRGDPRSGFEVIVNPQDLSSSPFGWHSVNGKTFSRDTSGNNAVSFKGTPSKTTVQTAPGLGFDYTWNPKLDPNTTTNVNVARVNTFYIVNSVHDFAYRYGFTERAFNFQNNNFGKGGKGNDAVQISVQDASGTNNARFFTPADGQNGIMRMFLFDLTKPFRDGAVENDIVVHEMTHGITSRMTGGGTARCLETDESRGLGEGWSDAMADWTEKTSAAVPDFFLGQFVAGKPGGIRNFPYSTSKARNPLTYSSLKGVTEIHDIGEVWANILHNQYASLVASKGFSPTARQDASGTKGNVVWLHIFIDALALQPCNPTFISARDAWIQADRLRYKGANRCALWKVFASRGLGVNAKNKTNDFTVPKGC